MKPPSTGGMSPVPIFRTTPMTWRTGYPDRFRFLDDEHEALAQKLQDVKTSTGAGEDQDPKYETLKFLQMLREHIDHEEDIMESSNYPEQQLHKKHHEVLLESVETILEFYDAASMLEHRESIVKHFENRLTEEGLEDRRLAKFLRAHHDAA